LCIREDNPGVKISKEILVCSMGVRGTFMTRLTVPLVYGEVIIKKVIKV